MISMCICILSFTPTLEKKKKKNLVQSIDVVQYKYIYDECRIEMNVQEFDTNITKSRSSINLLKMIKPDMCFRLEYGDRMSFA